MPTHVPLMTAHNHLRSHAGTSITKAAVRFCCVTMRPVVKSKWNKTTNTGFEA